MAQELESEVIQIFRHVERNENFLLSGGAGSGKTYSLVQVIRKAINDDPTACIACMTYTNAAVKEIEQRVNHKNLSVTTIHDFLWDNIKSFQKELKKALIHLINNVESKVTSPDGIVEADYFDELVEGIQYKEWTKIKDGIISHDEVIEVANELFKNSKLLCDILKDRYKFIFVDEYQDTHPLVVDILLNQLAKSTKSNIIGFFGDAMQSIYDDGVGSLNAYIVQGKVKEVKKLQNRRNPRLVIGLANQLRSDGIIQAPSQDASAPNMRDGVIKAGSIKFIYSANSDINAIKQRIGWNFDDTKETKELNLTHNLIAPIAGFEDLMEIYDKDKILDFKKRVTDHIKDNAITTDYSNYTFGQVIDELGIQATRGQQEFINAHLDIFEEAKAYPFPIFSKIYVDKDALIDDKKQDESEESKKGSKRDTLIKHLFKIQNNIHLYKEKRFNEFVRRTEYQINSVQAKRDIKQIIEYLEGMVDNTVEEVIDYADDKRICRKDDKFLLFILNNEYVFNRVKKIPYKQFQNLYSYLEGHTPFSTQHKIKGDEFENVFVVLDNGGWSNYNFEYLFNEAIYNSLTRARQGSFPRILSRSQKLFYVCCTRSKENLVVFYHNPSDGVLTTAKTWFGAENVIAI